VLVAALLPYVCAYLAKSGGFGKPRSKGGYDNARPARLAGAAEGLAARANAAQANSFEALPFFIGAVVIAHQLGGAAGAVDILAVVFVTLRVIYIVMYVAGLPTAARRSGHWPCW
jgi:uncharacterized MAPEG superfamily protein